MKNKIILVFAMALMLFGCKKDAQLLYGTKDNVYLDFKDEDGNQDTSVLTYSFAYNPTKVRDTIWVPVIISGKRAKTERRFSLAVVGQGTTAVEGQHYEALK